MNKYLEKHKLKTKEDIAQHIVELKRNTFPDLGLISSLCSYLFSGETQTVTMPFGREFLTVVVEKENHNKQRELNDHVKEILKDAGTKDHGEVKPNSTRHKASIHCGGYDKPKFPLKKLEELIKDGKNCRNGNVCFCDGSCKKEIPSFNDIKEGGIRRFEPIFKENPNLGENTAITPDQVREGIQKGIELLQTIKDNSRKRLEAESLAKVGITVRESSSALNEEQNKKYFDHLNGKKEAYKETDGKLFYELDWSFITQMAERMASNKKEGKYDLFNWKRPMTPKGIDDLKQATLRHLLEVLEGSYEDDGREFGHIEAVSDNMMMLNYQLKLNKS